MDVLRRAKVRNKRKHAPEQNTNYGSRAFGKWKKRKIQEQRMLLSKKSWGFRAFNWDFRI